MFPSPEETSEELGSTRMEFSMYLLLMSDHRGKQGKVNLPKIETQRHKARVSSEQLPADHDTPILAILVCELQYRGLALVRKHGWLSNLL